MKKSFRKFSVRKQTFFAKRLSFLAHAGVPILESIQTIKEQTTSKSDIELFEKIIADISNGQTLAHSLGRCNGVFGEFAMNVIKAGEQSGTLTHNLSYLADELKKKETLKKKILSAMLYPLIVTCATLGITGFLAVYIFPKILPIFQGMHIALPWSTRAIILLTDCIRKYGVYILLVLTALSTGITFYIKRNEKARYLYDGLILKVPIAGKIAKQYNLTNATRTLGLLLRGGISLSEALVVVADTTENTQYKKAFTELSNSVLKGKNISHLMNSYPKLFPSMMMQMISIGEKSGNLAHTLAYLSEYYENEFEELTKNLSTTVEPVLMILMGVMVGFIAISVITPIYEITNNIRK